MSYNIGETIFNLVTPSLYGTASVLSYTTAFSLGIGTFFAGEGVKQIVRPVFLKQLNLDVTKDIGNPVNAAAIDWPTVPDFLQ